ncbi:hypothetical protein HK099_002748 [Clydaea vesicula]|uniref:Uncharacterized protein n=1 Tax=Clydaea vesicula TaxID=447962 RepID=A0AAD5U2C7_9FUNG|nr:hypothetical protein HK099_002748 [Clydaea vesicula]KAJ3397843.1 hypothetical protein HDU92_002515 [Lobulomyces angularis]
MSAIHTPFPNSINVSFLDNVSDASPTSSSSLSSQSSTYFNSFDANNNKSEMINFQNINSVNGSKSEVSPAASTNHSTPTSDGTFLQEVPLLRRSSRSPVKSTNYQYIEYDSVLNVSQEKKLTKLSTNAASLTSIDPLLNGEPKTEKNGNELSEETQSVFIPDVMIKRSASRQRRNLAKRDSRSSTQSEATITRKRTSISRSTPEKKPKNKKQRSARNVSKEIDSSEEDDDYGDEDFSVPSQFKVNKNDSNAFFDGRKLPSQKNCKRLSDITNGEDSVYFTNEEEDDLGGGAIKSEIELAKTEAFKLKNVLRNIVNRYADIRCHEVDLEIEQLENNLLPEYVNALKESDEYRLECLRKLELEKELALKSVEAKYIADLVLEKTTYKCSKKKLRSNTFKELTSSKYKVIAEYKSSYDAISVPNYSPANLGKKRKLAMEFYENHAEFEFYNGKIIKKSKKNQFLIPASCDGLLESEKESDLKFLKLF